MSQRTGLTGHVLRAWERRYGVVTPSRTEGGQRLYSDRDIEHLALLRALTEGGYSIGQLAQLPEDELRRLVPEEPAAPAGGPPAPPGMEAAAVAAARLAAFAAIERFDAAGLRQELESGAVALGVPRFLDEVLAPILSDIGARWQDGRMSIAGEHLATAVVRQVLGWLRERVETRGTGPMLVVATPPGQRHEGGAQLVAATAAAEGWRVAYLGADLPVEEIVEAVRRTGARVVALSLLHPSDDRRLPGELQALRQALPAGVPMLVGGSAAEAYARAISAADGQLVSDLPSLRRALRALHPSPGADR